VVEHNNDVSLMHVAESLLTQARRGEQIEIYAARGIDTEVAVFDGEVESFSSARSHGAGIRVITGGRLGFAYAASLDPGELNAVLARARENAVFVEPDDAVGLAEPDGVVPVDMELYAAGWHEVTDEQRVALALRVEHATKSRHPKVTATLGCSYDDSIVETVVASTTGVRGQTQRSRCSLVAQAVARDGDDTQTGYGYSVGRHFDELDAQHVATDAAVRATRLLGATQPHSAVVTAVFEPRMTSAFLSLIASGFSAEAVRKGRSLFVGREGEQLAPSEFTLVEDPTDARAYAASRIDSEGLATRVVSLIDKGVLVGLLHNSTTARRVGVASTASATRGGYSGRVGVGARALALSAGQSSAAEVVASIDRGVLVTSMMGLHSGVNPVSGDFSVGIEGILITDGELGQPIREATMASSLLRMLGNVTAIGADVEWLPANAAGQTLAVADVTMSGR
jgi:PmbA protein